MGPAPRRPLGPQVFDVARVRTRLERDALQDRQAVALEPGALGRVVRQQAHRLHPEVDEDLRADPVVARVGGEPELDVRLDGVAALLLQVVRAELVRDADRSPLVTADVQDDAAVLLTDPLERGVELVTAVAPQRPEHVPGQALRVHAHEDRLAVADLAPDERDVDDAVDETLVGVGGELTVRRRDLRLGRPLDEVLAVPAVLDQVRD
jgi:hypothetical protein